MRLSPLRLAGFVSPEAPLSTFLIPLVVFVPPFYAGEMGLGLSTVGAVFAATKLFDVISDPVVGAFTDRVRTRFGRRRPWFVASIPLMLLCTYKIFMPNAPVSSAYFAFWMILLYVGWTLVTIAHMSWAAELSTDYHERSRIVGYKQAFGMIGGFLAVSIPVLIDRTSSADGLATERLRALGLFVMLALPITATAALSSASEPTAGTPSSPLVRSRV